MLRIFRFFLSPSFYFSFFWNYDHSSTFQGKIASFPEISLTACDACYSKELFLWRHKRVSSKYDEYLNHFYSHFFFLRLNQKSSQYFFSFTENAYEISVVASQQIIDNDFIPPLIMSQCHDLRSSNDVYRVLQVDDEGGQGI